ncbi:hypothetical protein SK128_003936 [Halocaridina rubra]|uniref:Uncharacterized protein n=1 Tax=Halocaridina rubra TaxID=373956 RepID=A0AAN9A4X4_HALRR
MLLYNISEYDSAVLAHPPPRNTSVKHQGEDFAISSIIVPACPYCGRSEMSSIPQTLQMTRSIKKKRKEGGGAKQAQYHDYCEGAEQPTKYSSKMMNSIWGQYNELSVHNFKSQQCGGFGYAEVQDSQKVLQQTQQQTEQSLPEQSGSIRQFFGELGQAVTNNFMDNMHQY